MKMYMPFVIGYYCSLLHGNVNYLQFAQHSEHPYSRRLKPSNLQVVHKKMEPMGKTNKHMQSKGNHRDVAHAIIKQ